MIRLSHPLVAALIAFVAGLLPALRHSPRPLPFLIAAVTALLAARLATRRAPAIRSRGVEVLLLLSFAGSGASLGAVAAAHTDADCRMRIADGARVRVRGVLAASAGPADGVSALIPLDGAQVVTSTGVCSAGVRVRLPDAMPAARAGARVEVAGEWVALGVRSRGGWPADPLYSGFVGADTLVRLVPPRFRDDPLLALRGATDERLRRLFPRHGPLAEALVLGRRERVDPEVRDRFARSGLVHLLAISGSHVGLLAGIVLLLGSLARFPRERLAWLTIGTVAIYLAMIGAPASAVRAGLMLGLALLATVLQRPSAALPVMAAAALAILAVHPLAALDPGFQLSFAGVLGITAARRAVLAAIPSAWKSAPLLRALGEALVMSAAAFVATAPITAHHFGQVAPVAVAANVPAVPLMAVALAGVVGAMLLAPLAFPLARLVADGAGAALDALDQVARLAAEVPYGHFAVARPPWILWLLAAAALGVSWSAAGPLRPAVRAAVAGGVATAVLLLAPALDAQAGDDLQVHFIDVGQGDAVAIRTPAGRWLLVDAGPRSQTFDAGERRVLPFLRAHGARRLEALILTHPDLDHIGGAPAVLRGIRVGAVVEPGLPVGKESYLEVLREVEARGVHWRAARSGRVLELDGVRMEFLWPPAETLDAAAEANQISAVVRVSFFDFALLLTGDVAQAVEHRLVAVHGDSLRAQVVKAGHHGSATSTSAELLAAARPHLVVISAGRRNRYGHPAPEVLDRLRAAGIQIARTDRDGTVSLRVRAGPGGQWRREDP